MFLYVKFPLNLDIKALNLHKTECLPGPLSFPLCSGGLSRDDTKDDRDMEMEETVGGEAGLGLGMMPAGMRTREQTKTGAENQK